MPPTVKTFASSAALAAAGLGALLAITGPAQAAAVSFTIDGTVTSPSPTNGYSSGSAVSFTWVLDDAAVRQARFSGPGPGCCAGTLAWYQDLFSTTPQLWSSITGTGLSGQWAPDPSRDTSDVFVSAGSFPQPFVASFGMQAQDNSGGPSGLLVNGLNVTGVQMNAVYLGLDLVGALGGPAVFSTPPPDATSLFLAVAGTYAVDRTFSDFGSIWANGVGGSQFTFRIDSLTISPVPEPATWALWLAGVAALCVVGRRRTPPVMASLAP